MFNGLVVDQPDGIGDMWYGLARGGFIAKVADNGKMTVNMTTGFGTVPVLVMGCGDYGDTYRVCFWQKLKNGKECCIEFDLSSSHGSDEPSVGGSAWLRDFSE